MSKENKDHIPEVSGWKGLKGEVSVILSEEYSNEFQVYFGESGISFEQQGKVGQVIADALNTIQKCNLMPSQLLEQRDELMQFIIEISETSHLHNQVKFAKELIKKYKHESRTKNIQ